MKHLTTFPELLNAPLFAGLLDGQIARFLDACELQDFKRPTHLLSQNASPKGVFLIAHGKVEVAYTSEDGHRAILRHAGRLDALGALQVLSQKLSASSFKTFADTTVLFCPAAEFLTLAEDPQWMRNIATVSYDQLRKASETKVVDQFFSAEQRIGRYLRDLAGPSMVFAESQSYLANAVGCTRQTVNKELSTLKEMGVIRIAKSEVRILDSDGLEQRTKDLG